jgi:hemolysin activation/secretion protein
MKHFTFFAIALAIACAVCCEASAQQSPLIIDQNRIDRKPPAASQDKNTPIAQPSTPRVIRKIPKFVIAEIKIQGSSANMSAILGATVRPFIGHTADNRVIDELTDAIAKAYMHGDIALYTIVVPDQSFANGIISVTVIEGYVQHADISGDVSGDLSLAKFYLSHLTQEKPLRKSTLQRYVSLLRDIGGLTPAIQFLPGDTTGAVRMNVVLHQKDVEFGFSLNTQGAKQLGRIQAGVSTTFFDLLQEGDATRIGFSAPSQLRYFQYYTFGQTEPVGDDGALAQLNLGYLRTRPKGGLPAGNAKSGQVLFSYPVIRSFDENLFVSGSFDALDSQNALLGETFANENVRAFRGSSSWSGQTQKQSLNAALTVSLGIRGLGARVANSAESQNNFVKFNLQASFAQQLGESWVVRMNAISQYSDARLPVSELLALGGSDYARGFPAASVFGDKGVAGSVELGYRLNALAGISDILQRTEIYTFADDGVVTLNARDGMAGRGFGLSSAGGGTRFWIGGKTALYVEAEKPIHVPNRIADLDRGWKLGFGVQGDY